MINGKVSDTIENKPFDKYFINHKIQDAFYKVGFIPFTRKCLSNPSVRRKLDNNTKESDNVRKLQEDYTATSLEAERLGFNKVFTTSNEN